jgi:hypothetical protein
MRLANVCSKLSRVMYKNVRAALATPFSRFERLTH